MNTITRVVRPTGVDPESDYRRAYGNGRCPDRWQKLRRTYSPSAAAKEGLGVFLVAYAVYAAVGIRVVVFQHVVVFDGMARLAHAYFVWHNSPPKLAAIGFVWPPLATIVFLPFAAIKPLATSLVALPLTSALFAAATLVLLNRLLDLARLQRWRRWSLVAAFGLNPMILFYATNGMSEAAYLFFLVGGTYWFVRWYLLRHPRPLLLSGLSFSAGILSRYELVLWAFGAVCAVVAVMVRQRVGRGEVEGSVIAFAAPVCYCAGLWLFFNWLILGDPLFWLRNQAPGGLTAAGAVTSPALSTGAPPVSLAHVISTVAVLNARLFPFAFVVFAALVVLWIARRSVLSLTLACFLAINALFTTALVYASHAESYAQLRYNMRAMPLAIVGVAWILMNVRRRELRFAVWAVSLAAVVLTAPLTWRLMQTDPQQYLEQAFTRALATGRDQEGSSSTGGYGVGIAPQRRMANYVDAHVSRKDSILTDDAQTFSVMLLSGRPALFWDRIDRGDAAWLDVREQPWGRVGYVLVSDNANDLIRLRYPELVAGRERGFTRVYRVPGLALLRVARRAPAEGGLTIG